MVCQCTCLLKPRLFPGSAYLHVPHFTHIPVLKVISLRHERWRTHSVKDVAWDNIERFSALLLGFQYGIGS